MLPLVPPCLVSASCIPTSLGRRYFSLAVSTWSLASLVFARLSKISRIREVLSKTGFLVSFCRLRSCEGDKELSNTITSASRFSAASLTSSTLPVPIYRPLLILSIFCVITPTGSIKQAFARLASSSMEYSKFSLSVPSSTPTSRIFSRFSFSILASI